MGHFVRGTKRIQLGTHPVAKDKKGNALKEWWEIKTKLSVGDKASIMDALIAMRTDTLGSAPDEVQAFRSLARQRRVATVGWQLYDDDGEPIPFDRELIDELDPDDPIVEKIDDAIAEANLRPFGRTAGTSSTSDSKSTEASPEASPAKK